jgi:acetylornithine/N-succinyldiaminopimelate aminotransferase
MPHYRFIPYNDLPSLKAHLDERVAAVILEPIQGEGGVQIPAEGYLEEAGRLCRANGSLLIVDEVQTGFCRTGPMFATGPAVEADFMTMAKGIAGGFPFGAFAMSEAVSDRLEQGDHGGTYAGNPLGCAVAYAVIRLLIDGRISENVQKRGQSALDRLGQWRAAYPEMISDVRGKGLLLAIEFASEKMAADVAEACLADGLFVRQTQRKMIRLFPALNITEDEMGEGLAILGTTIERIGKG